MPRKLSNNPKAIAQRERYAKLKAEGKSPGKSAAAQREYRRIRNAAGKPLHAEWYSRPDVKARIKETRKQWRSKSETKAMLAEYRREYRKQPSEKIKHWARNAVHEAIRSGTLERMPCEVCGEPNTDAHHDRYDRPLDVRWLCRAHHIEAHGGTFKPVTALPTPTPTPHQ